MAGLTRFQGLEVECEGLRGVVTKDYYTRGRWICSVVEYESPDKAVDTICTVEEMREILVSKIEDDPENPENSSTDNESDIDSREHFPIECEVEDIEPAETECGEKGDDEEDDHGDGVRTSVIKKVPLPTYGVSDERYVLGMTGKWYSREDAFKEGDVELTTWIDQDFPVRGPWYIEHVVDERKNARGEDEYLVKFTGYELNPGVNDEANNKGDWYSKRDGIDRCSLDDYAERKRKRARI